MAEFYAEGGVPGDLAVGTADAVPTQTERILAAVVQGAYFVGGIGFLLLPLAFWIVLRNRSASCKAGVSLAVRCLRPLYSCVRARGSTRR